MIQTDKTLLRSPMPEDREFLLTTRNNITLQAMLMTRARPNTISKIDFWLKQKLSDEYAVFFIIADATCNFPVGFIQLVNMDFINRKCELGICIDEQYHGKGYAVDALNLLEAYAKEVFNIHKILLSVLAKNNRAIQFYEKMMYRSVGILEENFYMNNEFHNVLLMEKII